MNTKLLLLTGIISFPFLPLTTAFAESFPKKNPVISYEAPENWKSAVNENGILLLTSKDERVAVSFSGVKTTATMEEFEGMLPAMLKILQEPVEAQKPNEHTEGGLTGYTATYTGKIENKPAVVMFVLFQGGENHSVAGTMILDNPESLPKNDNEEFGALMHSLKAAEKSDEKPAKEKKPVGKPAGAGKATAGSYPKKHPVISYEVPENWTSEVDKDDGNISINSDDERVSVNFAEVPAEATMESFKEMLPEMIKELKKPVAVKEAEEHTEDGLTGFTATYSGKVEGKPVTAIFVLFKAGKERSILGNMILEEPETMPKEVGAAFGAFMHSLKACEK